MRILTVIFVAGVVGLVVGGAVAYVEVSAIPDATGLPNTASTPIASPRREDSAPRVQVDQADHNFGTMEQGRTKSHTFVLRNVGTAPLTLHVLGTSCKCTVGQVTEKPIPPGESGTVTLEWTARVGSGPFRQTASIQTNDPLSSQIELAVHGDVTEAEGIEPSEFMFNTIPVGEEKSAQVYLMAMLQDDLSVSEPHLLDPLTADKFDIKVEPIAQAELPNPKAKAGVRITLTAKRELPVGHLHQWLVLKTNLKDGEQLEIPVSGRVVGDIDVRGISWNEEQGALLLGRVKSSEGKQETINLLVRGPEAESVKFDVASTDPPELKATVGAPKRLREDFVHVPLTIEVPIGTRPMVRTDTAQGEAGRIVLRTTHPKIKELVISVRFSVER